jgi:hypothetical protein
MSIRAELNIETQARNGTVTRKYTIEIAIDEGHNQGALTWLDANEARAFLAELTALLAEVPHEEGAGDG